MTDFSNIDTVNTVSGVRGTLVPNLKDADFGVTTYYYSGSDVPITICDRSGMKFIIYPRTPRDLAINMSDGDIQMVGLNGSMKTVGHSLDHLPIGNEICIKKVFMVPEKYILNFKIAAVEYLKAVESSGLINTNDTMYLVYTDFIDQYETNIKRRRTGNSIYDARSYVITIDHTLNVEDIPNEVYLYHEALDIVITRNDMTNRHLDHPFSTREMIHNKINNIQNSINGTSILTEIIDNSNKCNNKYILFGNRVVKLTPNKDPLRKDGVYYHQYSYSGGEVKCVENLISSLEQMTEKLGIYNTEEEAMSNGKYDLKKEEELERLKTKANKEKDVLEKEVAKLKLHNAEVDAKYDELKKKREDEFDSKKKTRDDYYEERSYSRKDSNELIKYFPAILSSVVTVVGAFYLFKNK